MQYLGENNAQLVLTCQREKGKMSSFDQMEKTQMNAGDENILNFEVTDVLFGFVEPS